MYPGVEHIHTIVNEDTVLATMDVGITDDDVLAYETIVLPERRATHGVAAINLYMLDEQSGAVWMGHDTNVRSRDLAVLEGDIGRIARDHAVLYMQAVDYFIVRVQDQVTLMNSEARCAGRPGGWWRGTGRRVCGGVGRW